MNVLVVGATGLCAAELISLLELGSLPINLTLAASKQSLGKMINFRGEPLTVNVLSEKILEFQDYCFFCTPSSISKYYVPKALHLGSKVIDLSSEFRQDEKAALIIPEINREMLNNCPSNLFCSPNCTTTIMLTAIFPLHQAFVLKKIVASTYQAASGGGHNLLSKLFKESNTYQKDPNFSYLFAYNAYPHPDQATESDYNQEEKKIIEETKKILNTSSIEIHPTCIRVPTIRSHGLSLHLEFEKDFEKTHALEALKSMSFLSIQEPLSTNSASLSHKVFVSRIRKVAPKTLELWVVGDQILKGASLNAFQIFQELVKAQLPAQKQNEESLL